MAAALVVNADDLGVTKGATLGVIEAHRKGIVTSASIALTTPWYAHALEACVRTCPDLGIGLHLTLTAGQPVCDARDVPLLVDERGFLRWRFLSLLRSSSIQRPSDLLRQIDLEIDAQLGRLVADGVRPDHIDGERHVHLIPGIFERVVAAARRYGVPFIRLGRDIGRRFVTPGHAAAVLANGGLVKSLLLSSLSERQRRRLGAGVRTADHFASYLYSGRVDLFLWPLLQGAPIDGVTEVMVHPGIPEESRGVDLGNRESERYVADPARRRELELCLAARELAGAWRLTNYRRLAEEAALG